MNKSEFAERVLAAEKTLYHISKSILKNGDDCADAVQEAILIAYRKLHSLRDERFFKTWLCRILINVCCKMARERKKVVSFEEYMAPEQAAETSRPDLYEAIMALPADLRLVVVLRYIEGFKTAEIADMLKIPEGTVKSRLSRARSELKYALDEEVLYHAK